MKRMIVDKCQPIIDYFLTQVDIDLNQYRDDTTREYDRKNCLCIDWSSVPRGQQRYIEQAAQSYGGRYKLVDNGSWMKCIVE